MKGYTGKILFVNLYTQEIQKETIPDIVYENFLSGVGLGAYILYNRIPAGADPLGPENILGFVSGLLTGTPSFDTGRWMAVCKSPLTGGWGDANCGGNLSPAIKQCGYDGIFFSGISETPVYLYVDNKTAELRSADHLWGKDALTAEQELINENTKKKKPAVAIIGQAGEKISLIAGICNDDGRVAARSGVGAVMGSKRLKAVVLAGSKPVKCENPDEMKAISLEFGGKVQKQTTPKVFSGSIFPLMGLFMGKMKKAAAVDGMMSAMVTKQWGTAANNTLSIPNGDMPLKNWMGTSKDYNRAYYKNFNPDKIISRETQKYHCYGCAIGCGGVFDAAEISNGERKHAHKPEYEACAAFGGLLMNKDLDSVFYINDLLNQAGMDLISAGGTIAFAIDCYENGVLTKEMTDGLELTWGNTEAIVALVKKMIAREGIGDLLADGSKVAAEKLGEESLPYLVTVGGQEPGMHDPKLDPMLGIHFSADPTPGRHTIGSAQYYDLSHLWEKVTWAPNPGAYFKAEEYTPSEKQAVKSVANSCYKQITDGAGGCMMAMTLGVNHWKIFEWLNAATGWDITPDDYMEIGKRIQTLRQMFNIKHDIDPITFKMSPRMSGHPPLTDGPHKDKTLQIEEMMHLHWKAFGWNEKTGIPTVETISELGLDELLGEAVR